MLRFVCCLAVVAAACMGHSTLTAEEFQVTENWVMTITPAAKLPVPRPVVTTPVATDASAPAESMPADQYSRLYHSIPFSRTEYNVNPSYRHDTAMELLTGHPRHQTTVQHSTPPAPPVTQNPPGIFPYRPVRPGNGARFYNYLPLWNYRGLY